VARINSCVNRWAAAGFCVVLTALLCVVGTPIVASAQVAPKRSILMVVDTSGSMAGSRIEQARNALTASIDALSTEDSAGLRRYSGSCGDGGQLLVAPGRDNRPELRSAVAGLSAGGGTPTPDALRAAAGDFPADAT
jgi:Mg-chelatase subunit ChlD